MIQRYWVNVMIHTENLTKKFRNICAVDNLNLDIKEGEVFGFLGPNGAGKTTTVRMLASLIRPTSGKATIAGLDIGRQDIQIRKNIGLLTEAPGLYDNLSAKCNLVFYAKLHEVKDVSGQVEKYLRILGLWERRNDVAGTFSKGMKQKLAIARALLHEPRLLFLDEPTSGLDPEASHVVREFVTQLRREGRTIFLCTHNLDEAERLCDRVGIFKTQILALDSPAALRQSLFGRKVVIHLRSATEALKSCLQPLEFIKTVSIIENKIVVQINEPEQNNPEMIRVLVNANADIQFIGEIRTSLEEVYLQLVKND